MPLLPSRCLCARRQTVDEEQPNIAPTSAIERPLSKAVAGITPLRFPKTLALYSELAQQYGDEVFDVIPQWVSDRGGIEETRGNKWSAKNFLDDAEDLLDSARAEQAEVDAKHEERDLIARVKAAEGRGKEAYMLAVRDCDRWYANHRIAAYLFPPWELVAQG
jgi:hypothetical protein